MLGNGTPMPPENGSNILDFRQRLDRIESAVKPLENINITLEHINDRLGEIKEIFSKIVDHAFIALKWLGVGIFIIVLVAMGFKEFGQFLGK